jgi:integrase
MIYRRKRASRKGARQEYSYCPMIWVRDRDGDRRQIWGGSFRTKAEARAAERKMLEQREAGLDLKPTSLTVADLCRQYIDEKRTRLKASSLQRSEELLSHMVSALGTLPAAKLRAADVSRVENELQRKLSRRTVRHAHWQLHGALELAVKWNQIPANVAAKVSPPEPDPFEGRALTEDELRRLFEAMQGQAMAPLILLALDSGAREGELLALRWSDVDLDTGNIFVGRNLRRMKDGFHFSEPKTKRSRRTVEVSAPTRLILKAHRQRQLELRLRVGDVWTDLNLVFPTDLGTPQSGSYVSRAFKKIAARAGIDGVRFHDLRHSSVSLLLKSGEPMAVVSRRAGHSNIGTTVDTYGHLLDAGGSTSKVMGAIIEKSGADLDRWLANG